MANLKFIKNLTAGAILALATCPQAWAYDEINCPSESVGASICWTCGTNCTAVLDSSGKLSIQGGGTMKGYGYTRPNNGFLTTAPWKDKINDITSIEVRNVSNIGDFAFVGLKNVTKVDISDNVSTIGTAAIHSLSSLSELYLPPSITSIGAFALDCLYGTNILVAQNMSSTAASAGPSANILSYKQEGDMIYLYDKDNNLKGIFESQSDLKDAVLGNGQARIEYGEDNSFTVYNSTGDKGVKYTANGDLLAQYIKGADGSTAIYDANGKLTGLKNAKSITPAQAAALIKKCNCNTVKLTFK